MAEGPMTERARDGKKHAFAVVAGSVELAVNDLNVRCLFG